MGGGQNADHGAEMNREVLIVLEAQNDLADAFAGIEQRGKDSAEFDADG